MMLRIWDDIPDLLWTRTILAKSLLERIRSATVILLNDRF